MDERVGTVRRDPRTGHPTKRPSSSTLFTITYSKVYARSLKIKKAFKVPLNPQSDSVFRIMNTFELNITNSRVFL